MRVSGFLYAMALVIVSAQPSLAKEKLPSCPKTHPESWNNCVGRQTSADGKSYYVGEFKDGKFSGQGVFKDKSGAIVEGLWENDSLIRGTYHDLAGDVYTGEFKQNVFDGEGEYTASDGERYVGQFNNGRYSGDGTLTTTANDVFKGEFKDGLPNGKCNVKFSDGATYNGECKDGKKSGHGTWTLYSSTHCFSYVGEFADGVMNGQGTMFFCDQSKIEGGWKDGVPSGKSTRYAPDGSVVESGVYKSGKLVTP